MSKENAELRGACTQHAVRMDTRFNGIVESIKGQDMVDLVETVAADMIEIKIEAAFKTLSADVDRMTEIIEIHEKREQGMATYLDNLMGERPAEGAVIMKSFELVDTQILSLNGEMARQYAETSEQLAFMKSSLMQAGAQPVGVSATSQSELDSVKLHFTVLAVAVDELKGARGVENLTTRMGVIENTLRAVAAGRGSAPSGPCGPCGGSFVPSGSGPPTAFSVAQGGNGVCHCHHVTELIGTSAGLGARIATLELARGRAPLIGSAD